MGNYDRPCYKVQGGTSRIVVGGTSLPPPRGVNRLAVVMPAWNEAEGLPGFLIELNQELREWLPVFIVVDDFSSDETKKVCSSLSLSGIPVQTFVNECNMGHGPSTVKALSLGLAVGAEFVLAVDGDGEFIGEDIRLVIKVLESTKVDIVEGVRTGRNSPRYRRTVSALTRLLVASRARVIPQDANTPLRGYRSSSLAELMFAVPNNANTPNLVISVLCRKWGMKISEVPVRSVLRRGVNPEGSTWGKARKGLPSKRFIFFLFVAVRDWATTAMPSNSPSKNK